MITKLHITSLMLLLGLNTSYAAVPLTLQNVTEKAQTQNLLLKEKMVQAHSAQETVKMNRLSLLPKLNLHNLLAAGGVSIINMGSIIDDIAPFLIPANWFRVKEAEISRQYQYNSMKSLWGNEILDVRALYLNIVSDLRALAVYEQYKKDLSELQAIAETRDQFGGDRLDTLEMLLAQKARIIEDQIALRDLINQETYNLTQMTQIDPAQAYEFDKKTKVVSSWNYLGKDQFVASASQLSPEVQSYDDLQAFLKQMKKEITFSIFGSSSLSQGVAGGVFDDLPTSGGWGFSTRAAFALNQNKSEQLKLQQTGAKEILKRQILRLYDQNGFLNEKEQVLIERKKHLDNQWQILLDRLQFGKNAPMDELIYNRQGLAETQIALIQIDMVRSQMNDRAHRMLWWEAYRDFKQQ
jgi:hypothetical protein